MPLTFEEIVQAVRGRQRFNTETRKWEIVYREKRHIWIQLMKAVSGRVFALPAPTLKAEKVLT